MRRVVKQRGYPLRTRVYVAFGDAAMPIHDWTRVRANRFHYFQQTWTANLAAALNAGLLPSGYFALAEQMAGVREADVVAMELTPAYVEPVAVGHKLPAGPVFLSPGHYIPCPLEATYESTWSSFAALLEGPLEIGRPPPDW